jgi:hypothetical protein
MSTPWDGADIDRARRAVDFHIETVRELERFLDRLPGPPGASEVAEYANLAAREEAARADRIDSFTVLGLDTPSVE